MQGASTAELAAVKDVSAEAVADFIRFPELFQFDLLEAEAVAQLHNDKQHGPLHELLTMLLTSSNVKVRYMLQPCMSFVASQERLAQSGLYKSRRLSPVFQTHHCACRD